MNTSFWVFSRTFYEVSTHKIPALLPAQWFHWRNSRAAGNDKKAAEESDSSIYVQKWIGSELKLRCRASPTTVVVEYEKIVRFRSRVKREKGVAVEIKVDGKKVGWLVGLWDLINGTVRKVIHSRKKGMRNENIASGAGSSTVLAWSCGTSSWTIKWKLLRSFSVGLHASFWDDPGQEDMTTWGKKSDTILRSSQTIDIKYRSSTKSSLI